MRPYSSAATIPSPTLCSTAWARISLSRSLALSVVTDAIERCNSCACRYTRSSAATFARSTSGRIGVKMKSTAPLAYAALVCVSSRPNAETKMIGVCALSRRCRIRSVVS